MAGPVNNSFSNELRDFYSGTIAKAASEEVLKYEDVDQDHVIEVRNAYIAGKLTNDELRQVSNNLNEDWSRAFLHNLANNAQTTQLKLDLAQDGINLTDDSDIGEGLRFETYSDKLIYVTNRFDFLTNLIVSSVVLPDSGFSDLFDFSEPPPDQSFNNPSIRDALAVDVPTAFGGTSSVVIGVSETTVDEWRQLLEEVPGEADT